MADTGHNSKITDDERKAIFFSHFRKIQAQKAVVDAANDELKKLRKSAKADQIKLSDMDFAMRAVKLEDDNIIPDEIKSQLEIMQWLGMPVGHQPDLFADRRPGEERAHAEGTAAGLKAGPRESPYGVESAMGQEWLRGYDAAQANMAEDMKSAMEKRNAESQNQVDVIKGSMPDADENDDDNIVQMKSAE